MDMEANMQWKVIAGALTFAGRIYVPEALCNQVLSLFHDNPESGHFAALGTAELVSRDFYWFRQLTTVRKYIASCDLCHRINELCHTRDRINLLLTPLYNP
jgi:hypothetical protein